MTAQGESTECCWVNITQNLYIVLVCYESIAIQILELERTWTDSTYYGCSIGYTILQNPTLLSIVASKVAHLVATSAIQTESDNLTERIAYRNPVVVTNLGRSPVGVPTKVVHYTKALNLILVEADVTADVDTPVLLVNGVVGEAELKTLILGLTHVAILVVVTCTANRELDEQILCGVQIGFDSTVQLTTEQGEVQTYVTGDGGLPLQVGVSHGL